MLHFTLGTELSVQLRGFSERQGMRLPLVMLALFIMASARWCERTDMVLSIASHGRFRPELKKMVGYVATLPHLRVDVQRNASLEDLLKQVLDEFYSAKAHHDFDRVPQLISDCRTELNFNWLPTTARYQFLPPNWTFNSLGLSGATDASDVHSRGPLEIRPFPLPLLWWYKFLPFFYDNGGVDIHCAIAHQPDFVEAATVERFVDDLRRLAMTLLQKPFAALSAVR